MNWFYESGGQQQGPISDGELDRLLAEGKITPETLVWREGLAAWSPLRSTRASVESGPGAPTFPPASESPGAGAAPDAGEVPPGYIRCTLTGKYFPPSEIIYLEGRPYSAEAKPEVLQSLQAGAVLPGSDLGRTGPAWEQRESLGLLKAIWETIVAVLTRPSHTFSTMRREGGLGSPLLFLLLTAGIGGAIGQLWQLVFQGAMMSALLPLQGGAGGPPNPAGINPAVFGMNMGMQVAFIFAVPLFVIIGSFINAAIVHLALRLFGGANQPFETTMRAICFTSGAGGAFNLIPICGGMIGPIWALVVLCIGLGKAHDTSTEKGVAAVLVPMVVCCGLSVAVFAMLFAGMFAAGAASAAGP